MDSKRREIVSQIEHDGIVVMLDQEETDALLNLLYEQLQEYDEEELWDIEDKGVYTAMEIMQHIGWMDDYMELRRDE